MLIFPGDSGDSHLHEAQGNISLLLHNLYVCVHLLGELVGCFGPSWTMTGVRKFTV